MPRYIRSTSKNITLLLNFPYIYPHIQSHSPPGAVLAVAARLLWIGLTCQSIRGRFSRLTLLPRELSTNKVVVYFRPTILRNRFKPKSASMFWEKGEFLPHTLHCTTHHKREVTLRGRKVSCCLLRMLQQRIISDVIIASWREYYYTAR